MSLHVPYNVFWKWKEFTYYLAFTGVSTYEEDWDKVSYRYNVYLIPLYEEINRFAKGRLKSTEHLMKLLVNAINNKNTREVLGLVAHIHHTMLDEMYQVFRE